jgi:hypothetical protein
MIDVDTHVQWNAVLTEKNAVLFVYAEWSDPAMKRHAVVEAWEESSFTQHAPPGTRIFSVQPWGLIDAHHWIYEQPQLQFRNAEGNLTCLAACGSLVWLRSGVVANVVRRFSHDLVELDRLTEMAFTS